MARIEAHLIYDPDGYPALIARTAGVEAVRLLKTLLLEEALERLAACEAINDPVLYVNEEADVARLRAVLDVLIPPGGAGGSSSV